MPVFFFKRPLAPISNTVRALALKVHPQLPVSLLLTLPSLTRLTATIWWKILRIRTQNGFFLPRQPEPKPPQPAAVKLLGPP